MTRSTAPPLEPATGIQRSDPLPYYAQLAQILRDEIGRGRWEPGDLLPSEADLGAFFGLSRTAVRQALDVLQSEGLVRKEKGRGTFVARPKVAQFVVQELRGFHEEMTQRGRRVETEIFGQDIVEVPPDVAVALEVPMGSRTVLLQRVRHVDGNPVVEVHTYLPVPRFADVVNTDLRTRSLYSVLDERFGVRPHGGLRTIDAVSADRERARHLEVRPGTPLLRLDAINLDADGAPFEFFRGWYRGDMTTFQIWLEART